LRSCTRGNDADAKSGDCSPPKPAFVKDDHGSE
jgi:hypothetical protein